MSSISSVFVLNEYGDLEINKPELRKKDVYRRLLERDKGSRGDYDGRKKLFASKELLYVYLVLDPRSMYKSLPESFKKEKAKVHCELPDDWEEDDLIKEVLVEYGTVDMLLNSTANAYISADKALTNLSNDLHILGDLIQDYKNMLLNIVRENQVTKGDVSKLGLFKDATAVLKALSSTQKEQTQIIKDLPTLASVVNDLAAKYSEEGGANKIVTGGGSVNNREE